LLGSLLQEKKGTMGPKPIAMAMTIPAMDMILPQGSAGNIPAFLAKLWKMVNNPDIDHLICWSEEGKSFIIRNQTEFAKLMLPHYYKHANMASFVRQLNMYDFHKVMNVEVGGLKAEREEVEFAHPYFERGQEHLLDQIKRKVSLATRGGNQIVPVNTEKVSEVFTEVGMLKNRQEDLDEKLQYMRHENSELWKEVENLRDKHSRQQRIVNKLIQFLGAMVQTPQTPNGIGHKRKLQPSLSMIQLAIEGEEEASNAKEPKIEFPVDVPSDGPIIQEVTEDVYTGPAFNSNSETQNTLMNVNVQPTEFKTVIQPLTTVTTLPTSESTGVMTSKRPVFMRQMTREDIDMDVSNIGMKLADIDDILRNSLENNIVVDNLFDAENETVPTLYTSEEGLCLQDGLPLTLSQTDGGDDTSRTSYAPPAAGTITELDLNTPLVQDESQDPLKQLLKKI